MRIPVTYIETSDTIAVTRNYALLEITQSIELLLNSQSFNDFVQDDLNNI